MGKMRTSVFLCGILLLLCATSRVSCLSNAEFYDLVKDYITEEAESDDVKDDVIDLPGGSNENVEIERFLNQIGDLGATLKHIKQQSLYSDKCKCESTSCQCCISKTCTFQLPDNPDYKFELNACLNAAIKTRGFEISFIVNGDTLLHRGYSLQRGITLCFPLPNLEEAKICLNLYNVDLRAHSMCARLNIKEFKVELGCFQIGKKKGFDSYFDRYVMDISNPLRYTNFPKQQRYPQLAKDTIDE